MIPEASRSVSRFPTRILLAMPLAAFGCLLFLRGTLEAPGAQLHAMPLRTPFRVAECSWGPLNREAECAFPADFPPDRPSSKPTILYQPEIQYPPSPLRRRVGAKVDMLLSIHPSGDVADVQVTSATDADSDLLRAAVAAAYRLRLESGPTASSRHLRYSILFTPSGLDDRGHASPSLDAR